MNEQTRSVKVTAEAEGELVIETREGAEEIYYLCPNRTMHLHVGGMHLCRDVNPFPFSEDNPGLTRQISLFVRGTATLQDSSISVIGNPRSEARTLAIDFYAVDNNVWHKDKELAQILGKAPHFAHAKVGLARHHPEVGSDNAWFVQCQVLPAMLHALANALSRGAIDSFSARLALQGIYARGAGVLQPVSSGWFLRPNWRDNTVDTPETAYGEITLLDFKQTQVDASPQQAPQPPASGDATPARKTK